MSFFFQKKAPMILFFFLKESPNDVCLKSKRILKSTKKACVLFLFPFLASILALPFVQDKINNLKTWYRHTAEQTQKALLAVTKSSIPSQIVVLVNHEEMCIVVQQRRQWLYFVAFVKSNCNSLPRCKHGMLIFQQQRLDSCRQLKSSCKTDSMSLR